jgi:hypothetical protein
MNRTLRASASPKQSELTPSRHRGDWKPHTRSAVEYGSTQRNLAAGHVPRDAEPRGLNGTPKEAGRLKSHDDFEALSAQQPEKRFVDFPEGSNSRGATSTTMPRNATS